MIFNQWPLWASWAVWRGRLWEERIVRRPRAGSLALLISSQSSVRWSLAEAWVRGWRSHVARGESSEGVGWELEGRYGHGSYGELHPSPTGKEEICNTDIMKIFNNQWYWIIHNALLYIMTYSRLVMIHKATKQYVSQYNIRNTIWTIWYPL